MRFITSLVATAACLAPVRADFWLFLNFYLTGDETGSVETWYEFFASDPSCSDVDNAPIFTDSEDLSHDGDVGVRCEGCNLANADPTEVEIKGSNGWWTWYKDRNGDLVTSDGVSVGNCVVDTSLNYDCTEPGAPFGAAKGVSQIHCTTGIFPAQ